MRVKLSKFWASLPHAWKTAIIAFGGAAAGVLGHAIIQPDACLTGACLHGYIVAAIAAGVTAVGPFYLPSPLRRTAWPGEALNGVQTIVVPSPSTDTPKPNPTE